jgi:hypothetical protein
MKLWMAFNSCRWSSDSLSSQYFLFFNAGIMVICLLMWLNWRRLLYMIPVPFWPGGYTCAVVAVAASLTKAGKLKTRMNFTSFFHERTACYCKGYNASPFIGRMWSVPGGGYELGKDLTFSPQLRDALLVMLPQTILRSTPHSTRLAKSKVSNLPVITSGWNVQSRGLISVS